MINILYSASGMLMLMFSVLLFTKKKRVKADVILGSWFIFILLGILSSYINHNELPVWTGFFELVDSSVFLHGPMLWLYTLMLTKSTHEFKKIDILHFVPFLISLGYLVSPFFSSFEVSESGRNVVLILKMLSLLVYSLAALFRLRSYRREIEDYFSFTDKIQLDWLRFILIGLLVIWTISVISQLSYGLKWIDIPQYGGYYTNLAISLFVLMLGFFGIRQTQIFSLSEQKQVSNPAVTSSPGVEMTDSDAERKDSSDDEEQTLYFKRIVNYMKEEKPFLDGELSIFKLAKQTDTPPYLLSQIINQEAGVHFFDFVNGYRVNEIIQKMKQGEHKQKTLLSLAIESGFNSKASFNRVFKKSIGLTPKQYISQL